MFESVAGTVSLFQLWMLAKRHGRSFKHSWRISGSVEYRSFINSFLRDQTSLNEFDFPIVAQARVSYQPELLVKCSATSGRCRVVQGTAGCDQSESVSVDEAGDPVPGEVGVEGDLVPLDDVFEGEGDLISAVAYWDGLLKVEQDWLEPVSKTAQCELNFIIFVKIPRPLSYVSVSLIKGPTITKVLTWEDRVR